MGFRGFGYSECCCFHPNQSRPPDHPCSTIPKPPAYLYDLSAYREHRLQDELDEVDRRGGDEFDKDAARSRVLAIPDARLDKERRGELDFVTKTYNEAVRSCSD
jgi:hypothetical protein